MRRYALLLAVAAATLSEAGLRCRNCSGSASEL
jgi:hypothetical protein